MTGAELLAVWLRNNGIRRVFTFPGGTIAPLLDALVREGIEIICARHEQGAGYMALAAARLTGIPQVVMVTSGPGVTNLATVIADAFFDSTPLIAITGQVGTSDLLSGRDVRQRGFQQVDTLSLVKSIAKDAILPLVAGEVGSAIRRAFDTAVQGRPGPVVIDLPMDVQNGHVAEMTGAIQATSPTISEPSDTDVLRIAEAIAVAERPVILAGQGVLISGAVPELRELAESRGIPVAMSLLGLGAVAGDSLLSLGFVGHTGNQYAGLAIHNADVVLVVGARLDVRQTGTLPDKLAPNAKIIRIDLDEKELCHSRVECEISLHGDAKAFLGRLTRALGGRPKSDLRRWHEQIGRWKELFPLSCKSDSYTIKPQKLIDTVDRHSAGRKVVVTSGVGAHQQWSARHFTFDYPRRIWLTSGGHGAMGYDLPSAIGAQLAYPDYLVVTFIGDGSLQMNIQELQSAVDLKTPIKIFVLDNGRLGLVSQFQLLNWSSDPTTGNKINPDFARMARVFGMKAYRLENPTMIGSVVKKALKHDGPVLVHCVVDKDEDVFPMLLAGQTLDRMLYSSDRKTGKSQS